MVISRHTDSPPPASVGAIALPGSYLSLVLEKLFPDPDAQQRLLADVGIDAEDLLRQDLPLSQVLKVVEALDSLLPSAWHVGPCLEFEPAQHGPVGLAAISARTLGDALVVLARFEGLRAPWTRAALYREGARQVLELRPLPALVADSKLLLEMSLLALAGLIASLLGPHRSELRLESANADRSTQATISDRLGCSLKANCHRSAISVPAERLKQPCLLADRELHALMVHRCQKLLRRPDDGRWSGRVLACLAEETGCNPGLGAVAQRLGLSERSLSRHLAAEGSSYRQLLDQTRYRAASELLVHSTLPIAAVASRLGYNDPANFNRAFRRWAGISPGSYRQARSRAASD